jgi:hypothetical protein
MTAPHAWTITELADLVREAYSSKRHHLKADLLSEVARMVLEREAYDIASKPRTPTQRLYDATVNCAGQAADPDEEFVRAVES